MDQSNASRRDQNHPTEQQHVRLIRQAAVTGRRTPFANRSTGSRQNLELPTRPDGSQSDRSEFTIASQREASISWRYFRRHPAVTADEGNERIEEVTESQENSHMKELRRCKSCKTRNRCVMFLPCRHLVSCRECAEIYSDCVYCKQDVARWVPASV